MKVKLLTPEELTTIGVGAPRKVYFPESIGELRSLLKENLPVIGGGSNSVLSDSKTPLISTAFLKEIRFENGKLTLGAGVKLSQVLKLQQREKFSLFEFLAGIPRATVGGMVAQNAGAFGREIKELLESVVYLEKESGEIVELEKKEVEKVFGYRKTPFPELGIVLFATFKLKTCRNIKKTIEKFVKLRLSKQPPFFIKTAGSTFKNPPENSAGRLLDAAGLKGFSVGRVYFSELHANFTVNRGGAEFSEFSELIAVARDRIKKLFQIELELEVKIF